MPGGGDVQDELRAGLLGVGHLGGREPAGRLGRGQRREPRRMLIGRDPPDLVGVHADERIERRLGVGPRGVGVPEQRALPGCARRAAPPPPLAPPRHPAPPPCPPPPPPSRPQPRRPPRPPPPP